MNVKERADAVGVLRFVNVMLMETLAAWVPTTPEMEAKVLFGRHIWRIAQQADALGHRARELRAPLHYSLAPAADCLRAFRMGADLEDTGQRIEGFYEVLLGALATGYETYLERTDRLLDEPTVVICESALPNIGSMKTEKARLVEEFPRLRTPTGSLAILRETMAASEGILARTQLSSDGGRIRAARV